MKLLLGSLLLVLVTGLAACGEPAKLESSPLSGGSASLKAGTYSRSLNQQGVTRTYEVYVPPSVDQKKPLPVVIVLHGAGGGATDTAKLTGFSRLAAEKNFIVVYPEGLNKFWNDARVVGALGVRSETDDVEFIAAVLDEVKTLVPVDSKRVYATGMSNGGGMSQWLACNLADKIAAIAPVSNTATERLAQKCQPSRPVPVMMFKGTADPIVPYEGGALNLNLPARNAPSMTNISAQANFKLWANLDGCSGSVTKSVSNPDLNDQTSLVRESYAKCKNDSQVILYSLQGGGHVWPGSLGGLSNERFGKGSRDIDATTTIWEFFSHYQL